MRRSYGRSTCFAMVMTLSVVLYACGEEPIAAPDAAAEGDGGGSQAEAVPAPETSESTSSDDPASGNADAPEPQPGVKASPIRVPLPINTISGGDFASRRGHLEASIREACGGDLCVSIRKEGTGSELEAGERCDIIDTVAGAVDSDPPYVEVERGGELTVLVNVRCEDVPDPGGGAVDQGAAAGAPLRIPLPLDELLGRDFESGSQDLRNGIIAACGGSQCVEIVRVEGVAEGGFACGTIFQVPGLQREPDPDEEGLDRPYVEVQRGGSITLVVQSRCEDADASP